MYYLYSAFQHIVIGKCLCGCKPTEVGVDASQGSDTTVPDKTTFVDRNIQGGSRLSKGQDIFSFYSAWGQHAIVFFPQSDGQMDKTTLVLSKSNTFVHPQLFIPASTVSTKNDCFWFCSAECCPPQSQLLCALWKLLLIRTQKVPLLLNLMDDPLVGMWDCPSSSLWIKKVRYSLRGDTLWLKYLRQDRNVMAQRMWVTVTHDRTDYCVQTAEWPSELWCLPLLCCS